MRRVWPVVVLRRVTRSDQLPAVGPLPVFESVQLMVMRWPDWGVAGVIARLVTVRSGSRAGVEVVVTGLEGDAGREGEAGVVGELAGDVGGGEGGEVVAGAGGEAVGFGGGEGAVEIGGAGDGDVAVEVAGGSAEDDAERAGGGLGEVAA